ncbi:MAG: peptidyl-prolyl cis-trans isomerase [Gemmatimonadota bacterium]
MMQAFRNSAKPVILVITITFLAWLIYDLSGLGRGSSGGVTTKTSVGKINGTSIDARSFDQAVQNAVTEQQRQTGTSLGLDEMAEVRNRTWEQFIRSTLLEKEFAKRGIRVSADEIADAIRSVPLPELAQAPDLQTAGKFDPKKYQRWLTSSAGQQAIPYLEAQYRDQILQAKLFRTVVSDIYLSDATLWQRYKDEKETVKVGVAKVDPAAAVADQKSPVSAAEAEAYYNQHKDAFKRDKRTYLSYIALPRKPNASDTAAALARATAIRDEILKGAPFEEVAKRESVDTVSGKLGGQLGEMNKNQVDSAFAKAAMAVPLGKVSDPILSSFGYHILKVESRKGDTFKSQHILIPIELAGPHRDLVDKQADSLEQLAAEKQDPAALDTAARALKLPIGHVGPIVPNMRVVVPDGGVVPDAGTWAFQAKPGEESQVIESPAAFYVFRLDSLQQEGVPAFASIKTEVEDKVRAEKKKAEATKIAESLAKQVKAGTPLAQATKTLGVEYREMGPFSRLTAPLPSPSLIGAAFSLKKGEVSDILTSDDGSYILELIDRTPADSLDFAKNLGALRAKITEAAKRSRLQAYYADLRAAAKIRDDRAEVYKTRAQQASN